MRFSGKLKNILLSTREKNKHQGHGPADLYLLSLNTAPFGRIVKLIYCTSYSLVAVKLKVGPELVRQN